MRTISVRLDDRSDALLRAFCERHGMNQTDALKAAIEQLAERVRPTPAELAARLGLIGGFRSRERDLGESHSRWLEERLRAKAKRDSLPAAPISDAARRKRA
jgi:hypothetical protein